MDDVEKLIRETAPARADGVAVPARAPDGYVHLSIAMAKVADALFQNAWQPWQDTYPHILRSCAAATSAAAPGKPTDSGVGEQLIRFMTDSFRWEVVGTGHRQIGGGGPVEKMPGDWWDVEDMNLRFRTWGLDPTNLVSQRIDLPHWIWVDVESLDRAILKIASARSGGKVTKLYDPTVWASFWEAVGLLADVQPEISLPAEFLVMLCQSKAINAVAGGMDQMFRGNVVLRETLWPIPQAVWQRVEADPKNELMQGKFHSSNGETEFVLHDVLIETPALYDYLWRNGYSLPTIEDSPPLDTKRTPPGPDPYKAYSMLEKVFRKYDDKLSNLTSDRARHNYLKAIWGAIADRAGQPNCPAYAVVARCWKRFKA